MTKVPLSQVFQDIYEFLDHPIHAVETGTSYAWDEPNFDNLSSLNISKHLTEPTNGWLNSIDKNQKSLDYCSEKLSDFNLHRISFICGESIDNLNEFGGRDIYSGINMAWLDSEEDVNHGEQEYIAVRKLMTKPYVICIDDYGAEGSVKWRKNSEMLKQDATYYKIYDTATGLIVGFFK